MNKIETISEFEEWIDRLKSVKITEKNLPDLKFLSDEENYLPKSKDTEVKMLFA